jgi:multidrug efflux system membrane fusion protein
MSLSRRRFALTVTVAALVLLGGGLTAVKIYPGHDNVASAQGVRPAAQVDVARVVTRSIIDWQNFSGRLEAVDRVDIRPQVSGRLIAVNFRDGTLVKQGDVLFTIDPRPFQAEVDRAEAQLIAMRARTAYTASDLARGQRLMADNAIARRDFEEKQNASREAAANLLAAKAQLESAQLNLAYTRITAPVSGRVSRAEVTAGNVVAAGAGSPPLTTLVSVSHLYASFDVDEQSFLKYVNPARISHTAVPVYLGLANESGYSRQGQLSSVDNQLDTSSGTIRVRAEFPNPDGQLVPGLYARIRLGGGAPHEAVLIDDKAIGTDQDKRFVVVVDAANKTSYREVQTGAIQDGLRVVESGLKADERIVVNGLQRVRPGDVVAPQAVSMTDDLPLPKQAAVPASQGSSAPHGDKV